MRQKGLAPILIVLLIAAVIGGYLVYTNYSNNRNKTTPPQTIKSFPSPDDVSSAPNGDAETANWKIYTNNRYGFSFSYPGDLRISNESNNLLEETSGHIKLAEIRLGRPQTDRILIISIWDNPQRLSARDWWETTFTDFYKNRKYSASGPNVKIDDFQTSTRLVNNSEFYLLENINYQTYTILFKHNNLLIEFTTTISWEEFERILSTLKFQ